MDAGVLQLHLFPHEPSDHRLDVLARGDRIEPCLTAATPVTQLDSVSLVVPTFFNRRMKNETLRRLLQGISRSEAVEEVVLVLGNEPAGDEEHFGEFLEQKRLVLARCPPNQRAMARNLGVEQASGNVLMFLDDDMLLRDWRSLDVILSEMLAGDHDCALFPRRNYVRFPALFHPQRLDDIIQRWRADENGWDPEILLDPVVHGCSFLTMSFCFPGCFMLIRRDAYDLIGGFPEEFQGWGFEDTDFAIRATTVLKVLNLFRRSEPLLHVDHPVSPYKSEEYQENFERFLTAHTMSDVDRLCRDVIAGRDFDGGPRTSLDAAAHFDPLIRAVERLDLPLLDDQGPRSELLANYEFLLDQRLERGFDPAPQFITLHGSRGEGTAAEDSDYDVLVLFRGGKVREFFVSHSEDGMRVEFEFSDTGKFEGIGQQPVYSPQYGPLEMAKLSRSRLLVGDPDAWETWRAAQLAMAVDQGRLYWMLYAVGMTLRRSASTEQRFPFTAALRSVLNQVDPSRYRRDIELLDAFQLETMAPHLLDELDRELPAWRDDMKWGRRLFAFQVPEVWMAMRWLLAA